MRISGLHIYPIKSCCGVTLNSADVKLRGLAYDRRMMIVGSDGVFLSQRTHPKMAQIIPILNGDKYSFLIDGQTVEISWSTDRLLSTVWRSQVDARIASEGVNAVISAFLGEPVQLIKMDGDSHRTSNPDWADTPVSFADGYPVLITTTASLDALNQNLSMSVPMARFRPNIVIENELAWDEDRWKQVQIGDIIFDIVKPCTRCVMTTLNPETGDSEGDALMRLMTRKRRSGDPRVKGVLFGWNAVSRNIGQISVGDPITVLKTGPAWPIC